MFLDDDRTQRIRKGVVQELVSQYLTDSERAAFLGLPATCRVREGAKVISPELLTIGDHCWIGERTLLDASGGLEIGEHTSIGLNCLVFTHSSWLANMALENVPGSDLIERQPVKIGRGCFIGGGSVIMPGVTIGERVTISPLTVVTKDVPDFSIVSGNPGRVFGVTDLAHVEAEIQRIRGAAAGH